MIQIDSLIQFINSNLL